MDDKISILIYEEDISVLKQLEACIEFIGYKSVVSDSSNLLNKFEKITPDIVIISQESTNLNIIEVIEYIKKVNSSQQIILILSENIDVVFIKKVIDLQVDKLINKPIDETLVLDALNDLLKEKLYNEKFDIQNKLLEDYKNALDLSFSVSKHDNEGKIFYVNELFCTTTSLSKEQAISGIINPLNNIYFDTINEEIKKNKVYRDRRIFKFDDNKEHILDIIAVAITDSNNDIKEFLVFSNDVSEIVYTTRKLKNQELDRKLQKLEHIKEINKVKDSFLTVFTHELKTPLNTIINFSEYIKKHLSKEEFEKKDRLLEQVSQINISGLNMLTMITNLIDAIKLKDSKVEITNTQFSINETIDNVIDKNSAELKDIKLIKLYKNESFIYSDEKRFFQILNNLISNAIKYCETTIGVIVSTSDNEFVVEIIDDGEGFLDKDSAIGLFEQSDEDNMTRTAKGMGVGLYIVKELCDIMDLNIAIFDSKKLSGASVVIRGQKDKRK